MIVYNDISFFRLQKRNISNTKNHWRPFLSLIHCYLVRLEANHIRFHWNLNWPNSDDMFNAHSFRYGKNDNSGFLIKKKNWEKRGRKQKVKIGFYRWVCRSFFISFTLTCTNTKTIGMQINQSNRFRSGFFPLLLEIGFGLFFMQCLSQFHPYTHKISTHDPKTLHDWWLFVHVVLYILLSHAHIHTQSIRLCFVHFDWLVNSTYINKRSKV